MPKYLITPISPIEVEADSEEDAIAAAEEIMAERTSDSEYTKYDMEVERTSNKEEIIIHVFASISEKGYAYDIFDSIEDIENNKDSLEGGLCTTTIENALEMAYEQAKDILAID